VKTRFESQLSRTNRQMFSTGFNPGDFGGSGSKVTSPRIGNLVECASRLDRAARRHRRRASRYVSSPADAAPSSRSCSTAALRVAPLLWVGQIIPTRGRARALIVWWDRPAAAAHPATGNLVLMADANLVRRLPRGRLCHQISVGMPVALSAATCLSSMAKFF